MKYIIIKFFVGNFELVCDDKIVLLTDENPAITVNEDDYLKFYEKYESMILNRMVLIQRIEPRVEVKQEVKKGNK